jgi:hypothetical protein
MRELSKALFGGAPAPPGHGRLRRRSGSSLVGVVEATKHRPHQDRSRGWAGHRLRRLQLERAVRPLRVAVADKLGQHGTEVRLVHDDQVIEALAPQGADDPLGDGDGVSRVSMPSASARRAKSPP